MGAPLQKGDKVWACPLSQGGQVYGRPLSQGGQGVGDAALALCFLIKKLGANRLNIGADMI